MKIKNLKQGKLYKCKKYHLICYAWYGEKPEFNCREIGSHEILFYANSKFQYDELTGIAYYLFLDKDGKKLWFDEGEIECLTPIANNKKFGL